MRSLLRTKRFAWALAVIVATALLIYSYASGRRYIAAVSAVEHTLEVSRAIEDVVSMLKDEETSQRGYLLTGDHEFLDAFFTGQNGLPEALSRLRRLTADTPSHQSRIVLLAALVHEKENFIRDTITRHSLGHEADVLALVRARRGKAIMDEIRALAAEMQTYERGLLARRSEQAASTQVHTMLAVSGGSVLMLLLLLTSVVTVHRDAERVRRSAEELARSEERFRLLADNASDLVRLLRPDGTHLYVSPSIARLLGYRPQDVLDQTATTLLHPDDAAAMQALVASAQSKTAQRGTLVHRMRHCDGSYRWFETDVAVARAPDGSIQHLHLTGRDVSAQRAAQEQLAHQAVELKRLSLRDQLTGLYNRRGFLELGAQLMKLCHRAERALTLVFIDLDGLKSINDSLGHELGDRAIREAAELLSSTCRSSDILARLGGDEFVLLAAELDADALELLKRRIDRCLLQWNTRSNRPYVLGFSVGAAFFDPTRPESLDALLARADASMYANKRARKVARASA